MKSFLILFVTSLGVVGCASAPNDRSPSSIQRSTTALGKGARITLMQPVPFINTESSKKTVNVTGRRSFSHAGNRYLCSLSAQVPKQNTFFFDEGTVFDFKEQNVEGLNYFTPSTKGSSVNLSCFNSVTGEKKKSVTLEDVRSAFPADVLVIEQSPVEGSTPSNNGSLPSGMVNHPNKTDRKNFPL
jgi:hypothetical protein